MGQIRDEEILKRIAQKIKELRRINGVTQEEFYFDTNIHIGRIESVKTNITVSTLSEICKYFGISLSDFFSGLDK